MSVFTGPSSSNTTCSLSKTSNKANKASGQNPSNNHFPGFLDAIFGCFSSKSTKSHKLSNRPTTPLLGPQEAKYKGRKTLVLDLDETLVHTSKDATGQCFRNMTLHMNGQRIFVAFRPGVKEFLKRMGAIYEIVIFTASMQDYAEQVIKALDADSVVAYKLFRDACTSHGTSLVKDLSRLSRPLKDVIILDNSTICYDFHPGNGLKIDDFIDNPKDDELAKLTPFLEMLATINDVRPVQYWQKEHSKEKEKDSSHKYLRIATSSSFLKLNTMSTEGHLTPAIIPKKTGGCPLNHLDLTPNNMMNMLEKEKVEVH